MISFIALLALAVVGLFIYSLLRAVRFFVPLRFLDRGQVGVLILIWGIHAGWDDYAADQLRGMGTRGIEGLEYFSAFFEQRDWEVNLPDTILTIVQS